MELVEKNDFVAYKDVRGKFALPTLILMHQLTACKTSVGIVDKVNYLDSILLSKVCLGYYPAGMYAELKDRSLTNVCSYKTMYGSILFGNSTPIELSHEEWIEVDRNRNKIGLPSINLFYQFIGKQTPKNYLKE